MAELWAVFCDNVQVSKPYPTRYQAEMDAIEEGLVVKVGQLRTFVDGVQVKKVEPS